MCVSMCVCVSLQECVVNVQMLLFGCTGHLVQETGRGSTSLHNASISELKTLPRQCAVTSHAPVAWTRLHALYPRNSVSIDEHTSSSDPEYVFGLRGRQHHAWITWGDVGSRLIRSQPESLGAFPCLVCVSIPVGVVSPNFWAQTTAFVLRPADSATKWTNVAYVFGHSRNMSLCCPLFFGSKPKAALCFVLVAVPRDWLPSPDHTSDEMVAFALSPNKESFFDHVRGHPTSHCTQTRVHACGYVCVRAKVLTSVHACCWIRIDPRRKERSSHSYPTEHLVVIRVIHVGTKFSDESQLLKRILDESRLFVVQDATTPLPHILLSKLTLIGVLETSRQQTNHHNIFVDVGEFSPGGSPRYKSFHCTTDTS